MKEKNNGLIPEERVCKKCGDPLISTNKYKCCSKCRIGIAQKRIKISGTLFGLGILALASVDKHRINKD